MDPLVELARRAVAEAALHRRRPARVPAELAARFSGAGAAACFVSLHAANGALRGCIGSLAPGHATLAEEILHNAWSAALHDQRFAPLTVAELEGLQVQVDVLSPLEPVDGPERLDPRRFGVVVSTADGRRGVLLPDLEGIDSIDQQLAIARRKAGIGPGEPVQMQRFTVVRHG